MKRSFIFGFINALIIIAILSFTHLFKVIPFIEILLIAIVIGAVLGLAEGLFTSCFLKK